MRALPWIAFLALACAHAPIPGAEKFEDVSVVEQLGAAISAKDNASAKGTDVLAAYPGRKDLPPVAGWITLREPNGWWVRFVRRDLATPTSAIDIRFGDGTPEVTVPDAASAPLTLEQAAMWRARQLALRTSRKQCRNSVNPVVLDASLIGQKGWLVYLLNPAVKNGEIVIGGHLRVQVSEDGRTVREDTALSRTCVVLEPDDAPGREIEAGITTQVDGEVPHETTVSETLRSGKDIYVMTQNGKMWKVSHGQITEMHP